MFKSEIGLRLTIGRYNKGNRLKKQKYNIDLIDTLMAKFDIKLLTHASHVSFLLTSVLKPRQ